MKKIITVSFEMLLSSIKCELWGSLVTEEVVLRPLPRGCPAMPQSGRTPLPRHNCRSAARRGEDPQDGCVPSSEDVLLLSLPAAEASPGSAGRGRAKPVWPMQAVRWTPSLKAAGAVGLRQGRRQRFPSQPWQVSGYRGGKSRLKL